jgi:hypothetical protein
MKYGVLQVKIMQKNGKKKIFDTVWMPLITIYATYNNCKKSSILPKYAFI